MGRRRKGDTSNFSRLFVQLGADVSDGAKKALADGGDLVVREAESRCPMGDSGALKESIKSKANRKGTRVKITADARNPKDGYPYGQIMEFDPKRRRPFMYPAMDARRQEVKDGVIKAIREAVRKNAKP